MPILMVVLAAIIWGMIGPLTHIFIYSPVLNSAVRFIVPGLVLYGYFALKNKKWMWFRYSPKMTAISLLNIVRVGTFFLAMSLAPISYIIFFLYLWPIFAMFLAVPILKEKLTFFGLGMGILAFLGSVIMQVPYGFHWNSMLMWAGLIMTVSAFTNALSVVMITVERARYSPMEIIFYQNGFGTVAGILYLLITRPNLGGFDIAYLTGYGFVIGIVSFYLYYGALGKIDTKLALILTYVELIVAFLLGITLLHEKIHYISLIGGGIIAITVGVTLLNQQRPKVEI